MARSTVLMVCAREKLSSPRPRPRPARPGKAEAGEARRCWEGREVIDFGLQPAQKGVKREGKTEITPSRLEVSQQAARGVNSQRLSVFSVTRKQPLLCHEAGVLP